MFEQAGYIPVEKEVIFDLSYFNFKNEGLLNRTAMAVTVLVPA